MQRYSIITEKNKREIVLLRGSGCIWKRCTFCDYHLDYSLDENENYILNSQVLANVTGIYKRLEVINSGSFPELGEKTIRQILSVCLNCGIKALHCEFHYLQRHKLREIKVLFEESGIHVIVKTGVETFDTEYREKTMKKGFGYAPPEEIAEYADEVCLLFGLTGQTTASMRRDIETGLMYFDRVCVNIMTPNTTPVKPDAEVIRLFRQHIMPDYMSNPRVDILIENTDFGVGTPDDHQEESK